MLQNVKLQRIFMRKCPTSFFGLYVVSLRITFFSFLKGTFILLMFGVITLQSCTKEKGSFSSHKKKSIYSSVFQENRKFYMQLPSTWEQKQVKKKYPLILVLDGDDLFEYVASLEKVMSRLNLITESIVLGISHTNRDWELTPIIANNNLQTGGATELAKFIEKELFPYLYNNYPLLDYRTIVGHSYGGLWALYSIVEKPKLFDNYVTLDASYILYPKEFNVATVDMGLKPKRLFLGIANTSNEINDTTENYASFSGTHIEALFLLRNQILKTEDSNLKFSWSYYPKNSHASVVIPGI